MRLYRPPRRHHASPPTTRDAILDATDELMRAILERNALAAEDLVTCIFTLTEDLDAEFPAVAAREHGAQRRAAAVRARGARAGRAAAHHPRADPLLRRAPTTSPSTSTSARPPRSGSTSPARSRLGSDGARVRRQGPAHPGLPRRRRLRVGGAGRQARLQREPVPADPGGRRGRDAGARRAQPLSRPHQLGAAHAAVGPLRRAREPDRGRQRLLRHPARRRRRAARARRGGRLRVALVLGLPAPRRRLRRARDRGAGRRRAPPRPRADARGDHRRHAARHRLQPEQPDLDRAPARGDRGVRRRRARATSR